MELVPLVISSRLNYSVLINGKCFQKKTKPMAWKHWTQLLGIWRNYQIPILYYRQKFETANDIFEQYPINKSFHIDTTYHFQCKLTSYWHIISNARLSDRNVENDKLRLCEINLPLCGKFISHRRSLSFSTFRPLGIVRNFVYVK